MVVEVTRELRDYQELCVKATLEEITLAGVTRAYYQLPTGGGKTFVASKLIEQYSMQNTERGSILFIAHRKELIEQTARAFQEDLRAFSVGICMAERNNIDAQLIVGSIQTLSRGRLDAILDARPVKLVLIDECHHVTLNNSYGKLMASVQERYPNCPIVGCTATPYRSDKEAMQEALSVCSFSRTIEDLQQAGYLAPTTWMPIHVDADWSNIKTSKLSGETDYNQEELSERLYPHLQDIVEKSLPLIGDRPFVVFAPDVKLTQELALVYNLTKEDSRACASVAAIWGDMPKQQRTMILEAWKSGEIQGVVNCAILTEGFDFPNLAAIVIARPTMSPGSYLQMVGRVTRPKSGPYQDGLIIDVVGNANLIETKQIVLPKVLEAVHSWQEEIMENPACLENSSGYDWDADLLSYVQSAYEKDIDEEKKPREYKILDPFTKSWVAWTKEQGCYIASLGNEQTAIMKRDSERGLWHGYILWPSEQPGKFMRKRLTQRPHPLREMMMHLNQVIAANGIKKLVEKNAQWRKDNASERQINYLASFSAKDAQNARVFSWSKGEVAQKITVWKVQHLLERL